MSVPDFPRLMLPALQALADGKARSSGDIREAVASLIALSEEDKRELLPSGTQAVFDNRVTWGLVYLQRAGLIERVQRGVYRVTDRGRETLTTPPERITVKWLDRFSEFREWRDLSSRGGKRVEPSSRAEDEGIPTPEEALQAAYEQLRTELIEQILERLKRCTSAFFERMVVDLLVKMGYGGTRREAGKALGRPGDEGIDGVIKEDRLGLDVIYLQAKKWQGTVTRPEVQKFVGALHGKHARKGVLITTSNFSEGARSYVEGIDSSVILIDGDLLGELMVEYGLGVASGETYALHKLDTDYFEED